MVWKSPLQKLVESGCELRMSKDKKTGLYKISADGLVEMGANSNRCVRRLAERVQEIREANKCQEKQKPSQGNASSAMKRSRKQEPA